MRKSVSRIIYSMAFALLLVLGVVLVMNAPLMVSNGQDVPAENAPSPAAAKAAEPATAVQSRPADGAGAAGTVSINYELLQALLISMPAERRQLILNDARAFVRLVAEEAQHQALLNMALAQGVHNDPRARFVMQRNSGNALREYYLRRYLNDGLDSDYPNEEQIREQYEKDPERYALPRRLHLWQIFLPVAEDADEAKASQLLKQIEDIGKQVRSGEVSFTEAARRYSLHNPSRAKGGYMGLVVLKQLREPFQRELEKLPEGRLSKPVRDQDGYHLIQHGGFIEGRQLTLSEAFNTVRNDMRRQARQSLRSKLMQGSLRQYPHSIKDEQVREWWQRLRAQAGGAPAASSTSNEAVNEGGKTTDKG